MSADQGRSLDLYQPYQTTIDQTYRGYSRLVSISGRLVEPLSSVN